MGYGVIAFEIDAGEQYNLLHPVVRRVLLGWLRSGCVRAVWLGTTCTSWSRARRGPANSSWGPLRSSTHMFGLPNLSPKDTAKVRLGNQTMRQSAEVLRCCVSLGIPAILENPVSSMLWLAPPMKRLFNSPAANHVNTDQCSFGARWRKRTKLFAVHAAGVSSLHFLCSGRAGKCSFSGKHHIVLSGSSGSGGPLWTSLAQAYPLRFGRRCAEVLSSAADEQHLRRLHQVFTGS